MSNVLNGFKLKSQSNHLKTDYSRHRMPRKVGFNVPSISMKYRRKTLLHKENMAKWCYYFGSNFPNISKPSNLRFKNIIAQCGCDFKCLLQKILQFSSLFFDKTSHCRPVVACVINTTSCVSVICMEYGQNKVGNLRKL